MACRFDERARSRRRAAALGLLVAGLLVVGSGACDDPRAVPTAEHVGALRFAGLDAGAAGVHYDVACAGGSSFSIYVPLAAYGLPHFIDSEHAGRPFADLFVVAPSGSCTVTARAMAAAGEPLSHCAPSVAEVEVRPDETAEIVVAIRCDSPSQ